MSLWHMLWVGTPPPNHEQVMGTRRPVKKEENNGPRKFATGNKPYLRWTVRETFNVTHHIRTKESSDECQITYVDHKFGILSARININHQCLIKLNFK